MTDPTRRRGRFRKVDLPSTPTPARISKRDLLSLLATTVEDSLTEDDVEDHELVSGEAGDDRFDYDFSEPEESFLDFVERRNPTLLRYEHAPAAVDVFHRWVVGEIPRLLVHEPPRYFKSEVFSRLGPAWILREFPVARFGLASYGAELAWSLSEEARGYYVADGGELSVTTFAKKRWQTNRGGGMWAIGAGGPALGFGYHFGGVDDPSDPDKWSSPKRKAGFKSWWPSKFLSRQEPDARIFLIMQRLGNEDPFEFLLNREVGKGGEDLAPENWHVLFLDEVKSSEPIAKFGGLQGLPETCTLEPDPREEGEVLAPSRFDEEAVERLQRTSGPLVTAAQRQGRPMKPEGDFWKESWFGSISRLPEEAHDGAWDWDIAETKKRKNAASAGIRTFRGLDRTDPGTGAKIPNSFPIFVADVWFDWLEFPEVVSLIGGKEGPHFVENKSTAKAIVQSLERQGVAVEEVNVEGSKLARATAAQPVAANGRIYVLDGARRKLLSAEQQGLLRVRAEDLASGNGYLDVNDVLVQAIARHSPKKKKRKRRVRTYIPGRSKKNGVNASNGDQP